jgi:hypothetical protein
VFCGDAAPCAGALPERFGRLEDIGVSAIPEGARGFLLRGAGMGIEFNSFKFFTGTCLAGFSIISMTIQ